MVGEEAALSALLERLSEAARRADEYDALRKEAERERDAVVRKIFEEVPTGGRGGGAPVGAICEATVTPQNPEGLSRARIYQIRDGRR